MAERNSFTDAIVDGLIDRDIESFVYVPSSHVAPMIRGLLERGVPGHLANREDEAVAIAGGMLLGGARTALLIQDNGFGNALTVLTTFVKAYHVGLPIVANTRGGLGEYNAMIHTFSEAVPDLLHAAGIRAEVLGPSNPAPAWRATTAAAVKLATDTHRPVVVLADVMHPAGEVMSA
jgi:sulfopyruvate decarboxylase subunit alpha